jgi:hypothetical protein
LRVLVGFTWRDAPVLGPLRVEQVLTCIVLAVCAGLIVAGATDEHEEHVAPASGPTWPEPESRPRF